MNTSWPDDLLPVRAPGLSFYVLKDSAGLVLLDAGFVGGRAFLRRALRGKGWEREPIRGIVLTHGHLDHILNVAPIARETGAWIVAPRLDAEYYAGNARNKGRARVGGALESMGKRLFGFQPFAPNRFLEDGETLEIWRGLKAVHLPGHTRGHTGYYCQALQLLFCADLFASFGALAHFPPDIFNADPELIPKSVEKALSLDLEGVLPNHCDGASPRVHLERLRRLGS